MARLPTGTVTFLFTDIEGSTQLLQRLGDAYARVLEAHAAIVRSAIAESGGVEVGTEGDSFFVAFTKAPSAVAAAVAVQRALSAAEQPSGGVRVRMGLHTGEGVLGGDSYVGLDINRAARISSAAHGGQILMSGATHSLVEHGLPGGTSLRDLGVHRLKDIAHPEHLHDVVIEGLPADFPPPRTLDARPNNLPLQLTSFVGREEESAAVRELVGRSRLVTLTGPGGTGKTRLALEVGAGVLPQFTDGVFFVDLAPVTDPALVVPAIARALGVPEVAGHPVLDALKEHLAAKNTLVILDNFEQVIQACPVVEALLSAAPNLRILVTSRLVLSLRGEHEYVVPPLEPPDPDAAADPSSLMRVEAVRLFAERAAAVNPRFEVTNDNAAAVAAITARLDGLPLAIELAASRTKILTPEEMLPRLQERLSILTSGARTLPQRQRTLRDAIAWSHDLLAPAERALFARLSVFAGGWTLAAADAVCGLDDLGVDALDGVSSLVDQSLVRTARSRDGEPPFSMLETIREFGREQLRARGELEAFRRRHAEHFLDLAVRAEPHLTGADQVEWLDGCDLDRANIRAALRWAVETGDAGRAQEAAGALWRFWQQRGHLAEGQTLLEEALAAPSGRAPTAARAKALIGVGGMAWWQRNREAAGSAYEEAVAIERRLGDPARIAEALYNLSFVVAGEDIEAAAAMLEEGLQLFRRAEHEPGVAQVLSMLVIRDAEAGRWEAVVERLHETSAIWRHVGDRLHLAFDLVWLAFAHGRLGHRGEGRSTALEALSLFREVDNATGIGITFTDFAFLANWAGDHGNAVRFAAVARALSDHTGGPPGGFAGLLEADPVEEARVHLSDEEADRAWEEGLAMNLEEAIALARAEPDD